jgi:hypothetical protein
VAPRMNILSYWSLPDNQDVTTMFAFDSLTMCMVCKSSVEACFF